MAFIFLVLLSGRICEGSISQPLGHKCQANEEYLECGPSCAVNCSNLNDPIFCTKPCYSGCFCQADYVRDGKGNCIHPRDCFNGDLIECPENEEYVKCVSFCNSCWESGGCRTRYCIAGCDCKQGFYRNIDGRCVTSRDCFHPSYDFSYRVCGLNEIFSHCVNVCNDCQRRGACNFEYYCEPGCDCRPGYFRNDKKDCVLEDFCFQNTFSTQSLIEGRRGEQEDEESTIKGETTLTTHSIIGTATTGSITERLRNKDEDAPKDEKSTVTVQTSKGTSTAESITEKRRDKEKDSPKDEKSIVTTQAFKGTSTAESITERRRDKEEDSPKDEKSIVTTQAFTGISTTESITESPRDKEKDSPKDEKSIMTTQTFKGISTAESITERRRDKDEDSPKDEKSVVTTQTFKGTPLDDLTETSPATKKN